MLTYHLLYRASWPKTSSSWHCLHLNSVSTHSWTHPSDLPRSLEREVAWSAVLRCTDVTSPAAVLQNWQGVKLVTKASVSRGDEGTDLRVCHNRSLTASGKGLDMWLAETSGYGLSTAGEVSRKECWLSQKKQHRL